MSELILDLKTLGFTFEIVPEGDRALTGAGAATVFKHYIRLDTVATDRLASHVDPARGNAAAWRAFNKKWHVELDGAEARIYFGCDCC